jgi:hypothetical protein
MFIKLTIAKTKILSYQSTKGSSSRREVFELPSNPESGYSEKFEVSSKFLIS